MMNSGRKKKFKMQILASVCGMMALVLSGCVDQNGGKEKAGTTTQEIGISTDEVETLLAIDDPQEKAAVEAAKKKVSVVGNDVKIIVTSPSIADICDRLDLDLAGVCTTASDLPERYADLPAVGTAMSPDMEIVSSLNPDWILSPSSLQSDLQPKYEAIHTDWAFLNLRSVQGLYRSVQELGEIFDRQAEAQVLVDEFTKFYEEYKEKNVGRTSPKVLVLMGLPGSYIIATENSYVGSLVELAGGENVYAGSDQEFLTVNTEDMKTKEPDIILCASHALPDQVMAMFQEDFKTNDIWKHFAAVQNDKVYYLTYERFGMSATFRYPEALEELQPILYPESEADAANSHAAAKNNETTDSQEGAR